MKTQSLPLAAAALFFSGAAFAQTNSATDSNPAMTNAPAAPRPHVLPVPQPDQSETHSVPGSEVTDPAKIADFQRRFKDGNDLAAQGKLAEARTVYDSILAEDPHARGSLLEAGEISIKLGELAKADDYLSRLHELEPDYPAAIALLIQVNQQLNRDVKVELLIREFDQLHDSGRNPKLTQSLCFERERIPNGEQEIVVSQFFDYTHDPNTVWMAEVFDSTGALKRRLLLNYDADTTRALRAKDAKYAATQVFTWFEHKMVDQKVTEIDAYLQIFALPDYVKFRSAMLLILANTPTPIYSVPVSAGNP